jgi:filamentous hemagglutinin
MAVAGAADPLNVIQEKMVGFLEQQGMSSEAAKMAAEALAQGTDLGIGVITGGVAGAATALTADTNNRQSTLAEKKWLKQLQKDRSEERQKRFADAAYALTRCSANLSDENPAKAGLLLQEQCGQSYISEQRDVVSTGLFRYGVLDAIDDIGSRTSSRAKLELAHVANGAFNLGYLLATNGPGGNVQMPSDPWDDTGGRNGPSAGTASVLPMTVCLPPLCITKMAPVVLGSPGYVPQNALLSGGQDSRNHPAHEGSSAANETGSAGNTGDNAGAVSDVVVTSQGTANAATIQGLKGQLAV